ncbi:hypothetical protein H920_03432 [Fukomys damarensis]|uniref:Uncharacterized protein n=1 Tax=Fukomys damarensis TaxID=885580 RepID=A0A091DSR1_FUKDA|nr:hypothetical protein H920_03432 [Fukomys damarensis]
MWDELFGGVRITVGMTLHLWCRLCYLTFKLQKQGVYASQPSTFVQVSSLITTTTTTTATVITSSIFITVAGFKESVTSFGIFTCVCPIMTKSSLGLAFDDLGWKMICTRRGKFNVSACCHKKTYHITYSHLVLHRH